MRLVSLMMFTINFISHLTAEKENCIQSSIIKPNEPWKVYQMRRLINLTVRECCYCKNGRCTDKTIDLSKCPKIKKPSSKCQLSRNPFVSFENYTATADLLSDQIFLKTTATCNYSEGSCFQNNKTVVWNNKSELEIQSENCNFKKMSLSTDAYTLTMKNQYLVFNPMVKGLALEITNKSTICNKTVFFTNVEGIVLSNEIIEDDWNEALPELKPNLTFISKKDLLQSLGTKCLNDGPWLKDLSADIYELKKIMFYALIAIVAFITLYIVMVFIKLLIKFCSKKAPRSVKPETVNANPELKNVEKNGHRQAPPTEVAYVNDLYNMRQ